MRNARKRLQKRLAMLFSAPESGPLPCHSCRDEPRLQESDYDREAIDDIRSDWAARGLGEPPSDREIVSVALHFMQAEIEAGLGDEVMEDVRREVEYRHWCAAIDDAPAVPIHEGDRTE